MTSANALTAYWWKGKPNFGDALNPAVLAFVSNRTVSWAAPHKAEIVGFGSILHMVRAQLLKHKAQVYVWGAGVLEPLEDDFTKLVAFQAVRGPLTASVLGIDDISAQGDPGLLAPDALDVSKSTSKNWKFGIIPHVSQAQNLFYAELCDALPNATVIDMLTDDPRKTMKDINDCEIILASSLHGLVVADALAIPNIWLEPAPLRKRGRFKFYDYGLSIGRNLGKPFTMKQAFNLSKNIDISTDYFKNINQVKKQLIASFPSELTA